MRRALLTVTAALALVPALASADEPRVMVEQYVAGTGDLACFVSGVGCTRFYVEGGETAASLVIRDEVHNPVAFDACSPDCATLSVSGCGAGTLSGLRAGNQVFVFIDELRGPLYCGVGQVGAALKGTVTATFT
ncbi:MAG TPA: hypothetical protein VGR28_00415 [Candidatus Thermoplasmatota archaeon]|jgi:hypothetical protein|nr:hypothetical protein [Candidatus Thermoplasmatota archaeon]